VVRRILWYLFVMTFVAGCAGVVPEELVPAPAATDPAIKHTASCKHEEHLSSAEQKAPAAVYVQEGELFGIDLEARTTRKLLGKQDATDFSTESATFSGNGELLVIHRDKEGRDSWWAASADGSDLKRLPLPVDRQVRHVVRLCQTEFVAVLEDGRFARFSTQGDPVYWEPGHEDQPMPDTSVVGSPGSGAIAFPSRTGVIVLVPNEKSLAVASRVRGSEIHGWAGDDRLVTGDRDAIYVTEIPSGVSRSVELRSVFGSGSGLITVSVHPRDKLLYVARRSSIPGGPKSIVALDLTTLQPLEALPNRIPPESNGAPSFSPLGSYEVWPVEEPKDLPYASGVAIVNAQTGEVLHVTDADMISVPYALHPKDLGFVFSDLSREGTVLVYQDAAGRRFDLTQSSTGAPIRAFEWNPSQG